jgi:tagatose 1,6-diphosphate aldolase
MTLKKNGSTQGTPRDHFLHLSPGKLTGLREITDAKGLFKVLALDQSNSFKKSLRALYQKINKAGEPSYEAIRDAKLEITARLGGFASAVLLDVNYGLRQALNSGALPRGVGLLARVEASRDAGIAGELEPGWSVAQIKRMGASAVKLLVYMDVEDKTYTEAQLSFVKKIHEDCLEQDILLLVEELSFPRQGEDKATPAYVSRRSKNIIESAKLIGPWCDILKLEYPADIRNDSAATQERLLKEMNDAAIRPWVLLSAGEKFDLFVKQVEQSMRAGSTGIMAGRAIFNEYFEQETPEKRAKFLDTVGVERMQTLVSIVDKYALPWYKRAGVTTQDLAAAVDPHWYSGGKAAAAPAVAVKGEY